MKKKVSFVDIIFYGIVIGGVLLSILPFIYILAVSLSSPDAIIRGDVTFFPIGFNTEAYRTVFTDDSMLRSMLFTVILTVTYTALAMFMTTCLAYPLTKKSFRGKKFFMLIVIVTMYFSGGIIPEYIFIHPSFFCYCIFFPGLRRCLQTFIVIFVNPAFLQIPSEVPAWRNNSPVRCMFQFPP